MSCEDKYSGAPITGNKVIKCVRACFPVSVSSIQVHQNRVQTVLALSAAGQQKYKLGNANEKPSPWFSDSCTRSWDQLRETYLDDVEDDVLVEAVQDTFGYTVVIPGSVDEQQILQVFELYGGKINGGKGRDECGAEVFVHTVFDGSSHFKISAGKQL